jgi:hypothetical protein
MDERGNESAAARAAAGAGAFRREFQINFIAAVRG